MDKVGIRTIVVNFEDEQLPYLSLVQGDAKTRGFDIVICDSDGKEIPPSNDYIVELVATGSNAPDTPYANRHTIKDGKYRVMIPTEALSELGFVFLQLVFYQKSTGAVIHTIEQKCPVYRSRGQEVVESNNLYVDITALRLGLEKIEKLDGKYEEIIEKDVEIQNNEAERKEAENKRNLDEGIRKDNERIRKANESKRENNEDVRIDNESKRVTAEADRAVIFNEMTESLEDYKTPLATDKVAGKVKVNKMPTETGEITVPSVGQLKKKFETPEIAMGKNSQATGAMCVAIGTDTLSSAVFSVAMGRSAQSLGESCVAIGWQTKADGIDGIAMGKQATTNGLRSVALGGGTKALAEGATAIGRNAETIGIDSIALGTSAKAIGNRSTALGRLTEAKLPYSTAIGHGAISNEDSLGVLGVGSKSVGTKKWLVPGDFSVGGTKNFEIPHPNPEKTETHVLRHGAVETNSQGDNLYRYKIKAEKDNDLVTINLPDYFIYLNKNIQIWATGVDHFGNAYGTYYPDKEEIVITCEKQGEYNILAIGTRNDNHKSVQSWSDKKEVKLKGTSWTFEEDNKRDVEE